MRELSEAIPKANALLASGPERLGAKTLFPGRRGVGESWQGLRRRPLRSLVMRSSLLTFALGFCALAAPALAGGDIRLGPLPDGGYMLLAEDHRQNVRPPKGTSSSVPDQDRGALLLADEVDQLLKGNTSEGFTLSSGNYREYYAPDGTILGKDFKGSWWIKEDTICTSYPGITTYCYRVRKLRGGAIVWELDGEPSGYARILSGNHFDF